MSGEQLKRETPAFGPYVQQWMLRCRGLRRSTPQAHDYRLEPPDDPPEEPPERVTP